MVVIYVASLTDCLEKICIRSQKHTVVENSKMQLKIACFFKKNFSKQFSFFKLCTNKKYSGHGISAHSKGKTVYDPKRYISCDIKKFFYIFDESKCSSLF